MNINRLFLVAAGVGVSLAVGIFGCSKGSDSAASGGAGQSYDFSAAASGSIVATSFVSPANSKNQVNLMSADGPTLCSSVICFTPSAISGKYYGTGLLIQSNGNGMLAYFGQNSWSEITGASQSYDFSLASPVVNTGDLRCCGGTGDLTSENTYISDIVYLFAYLDVTFAVTGVTGNTSMNSTYTFRFVLADGAVAGALRGDILIDDSGTFKWMNSDTEGLTATRPSNPVTMNSDVVNWTNPFGDEGQQEIPSIGVAVAAPPGGGVFQVNESDLNADGKTYTFAFNPNNFVVFPTLLHADINMISSLKELMTRVHLGGLPHSSQPMGIGSPADSELTITP